MNTRTPRLRMFAGPNGSGKSTLKSLLNPELLGVYINPDEIQKLIQANWTLDLEQFGISTSNIDATQFFLDSGLTAVAKLEPLAAQIRLDGLRILFPLAVDEAPYLASIAADFIRNTLIAAGVSFSFETVMSSRDKIDLLKHAQREGYRTYLYYVATADPEINLLRIKERVEKGGHDVPRDKVISRYHRSLALVFDAIMCSNRAYIFDNSAELIWLAEATEASTLEVKVDSIPKWFQLAVLDSLA